MPYKNIVFVQLQRRLLNDPRWWTMSDYAQLLYIKMLLLAADTSNKIPLNDKVVSMAVRSGLTSKDFSRCLQEVEKNFPKLKRNKHFRYIDDFSKYTNYIRRRKDPGMPKARQRQVHIDIDSNIDINKDKEHRTRPSLDDLKPFFKDEGMATSFFDYYTANGWKVGRNPMKDWKAAARNWQRRQGEFSKNGKSPVHHGAKVDLWKCFVCDKQVLESERRGHMIAHEKESAVRG